MILVEKKCCLQGNFKKRRKKILTGDSVFLYIRNSNATRIWKRSIFIFVRVCNLYQYSP